MASEEHKKLANIIKSVHQQLREQVLKGEGSSEEVWKKHLENRETLSLYADSMQKLATQFWLDTEQSRINWVAEQIEQFFKNGGIKKELRKDARRAESGSLKSHTDISDFTFDQTRLKVLDVGSCYNPFRTVCSLDVTAIDIAPANEHVLKCDFLGVTLGPETVVEESKPNLPKLVTSLAEGSFQVVVFCLLLEYLPTPRQRSICVSKAVSLLTDQGILCVVTPDSCHQGRNSSQLRAWKTGFSLLGLSKVTYEKSKHFHGLVYRKPDAVQRDLLVREAREKAGLSDLDTLFYIPQDFSNAKREEEDNIESEMTEEIREEMREIFAEMPLEM